MQSTGRDHLHYKTIVRSGSGDKTRRRERRGQPLRSA
jgi:hypothetical protein